MKSQQIAPGPKIALVSLGIGRVQRGFERMFGDLFGVLRESLDVTLFKGGGEVSSRERIPRALGAATALARALPFGNHAGGQTYKADCVAYALSLLPSILGKRFDVIHCVDPPLAMLLQRLQRIFRFPARLLFTEGCRVPPRFYPPVAHVHHVGQYAFQQALASGIPQSHMTLIPIGVHTQKFLPGIGREELRRKHGISSATFVILAVSNLERVFKRVDHIVEEVRRLEGDVLLWVDGHPTDPTVIELAREKLGARCRITYLPSSEIPELYQLADIMVHANLDEAFGIAVVEAMCAGTMVLTHDCAHFQWLVEDRDCLVDMSTPGMLCARLLELRAKPEYLCQGRRQWAQAARTRFEWRNLAPAYLEMYRRVAAMKPGPWSFQKDGL